MATVEDFVKLRSLAEGSLNEGNLPAAQAQAEQLLEIAEDFTGNWNYGNAIHHGNLILGRIALQKEDLDLAKKHLLLAGDTPGSPQLSSFGPNMLLAKELLEVGEQEIVLQYIDLCANFWRISPLSQEPLEKWKSAIQIDQIPEFGAHLIY